MTREVSHIETMAFAHETPWHGLGTRVTDELSYKEMLQAAGLDWTVSKQPLMFRTADGTLKEVPDRYALKRDSDDKLMSIASGRYVPVQNEEALRFFDKFVKAGKAKLETAGSLRGGKMIWGLAKLGADFKLPNGDEIKGYLLLASPHEVGRSLLARTTAIRVVCANTMAAATKGTAKFEARFPHAREFNADEAAELMTDARENLAVFADHARTLAKMNLTMDQAVRVILDLYQIDKERTAAETKKMVKDSAQWNPTVRTIIDCYKNAPGATEGNAWGLLNGATYRANHKASNSADARLSSAWMGTEAKRSGVLMDRLLQLA